jgi:hypothetical protein
MFVAAKMKFEGRDASFHEAVKKWGQAPSRPLIFQGFRRFRSEPVPFFHSLYPLGSRIWISDSVSRAVTGVPWPAWKAW